MGIFNKLAGILFDEQEEEEIPVITKDKDISESKPKREEKKEDEVIITKIEKTKKDDDLFDMPKFKEVTETEEKKNGTFTFPLIDDDEFEVKDERRTKRKEKENFKEEKKNKKYDFLSSTNFKYKTDAYTKNRNNIYDDNDSKKPFTLSPIISPVYGILNENYKKEDIVTRDSTHLRTYEKVDLDSVRKKAYGTLEDEIESSLSRNNVDDVLEEVPSEMKVENLKEDGLSIDDLLVEEIPETIEEEVFDIEEAEPEIDLDDNRETLEVHEKGQEAIGEEDLFDLIDSIYAGKEEE